MAVIACLAQIILIAVLPALLYAFSLGLQAIRLGRQHQGAHALTLYFLALNLCEPLVNFVLIGVLAFSSSSSSAPADSRPFQAAVLATSPMAVLLVPVIGLFLQSPYYRGRSLRILLLGLLRWSVALAAVYFLNLPAYDLGPAVLGLLAGTGILWFSAVWGRQQLVGALAGPPVAAEG